MKNEPLLVAVADQNKDWKRRVIAIKKAYIESVGSNNIHHRSCFTFKQMFYKCCQRYT